MLIGSNDIIQSICRLTNTTYPVKTYLSRDTFPLQDSTMIGRTIWCRVRNYIFNGVLREDDEHHTEITKMYVVRYDAEPPYITIGVNGGYVYYYKRKNNLPWDENNIVQYPEQHKKHILAYTNDVYSDLNKTNGVSGVIVRCDESEPAIAIIVETTANNELRFITADEAICIITEDPVLEFGKQYNDQKDIEDLLTDLTGEYKLYGALDE